LLIGFWRFTAYPHRFGAKTKIVIHAWKRLNFADQSPHQNVVFATSFEFKMLIRHRQIWRSIIGNSDGATQDILH